MKFNLTCTCIAALLSLYLVAIAKGDGGPFVNGKFQGRIAYSADGNHNDPDDWIASPVALAIFAECGLKDRLVHFDYNCILPQTNPEWEQTHGESVLGAAERYGYEPSRFFDCRKEVELQRAVADIARAINESSANNPLWFILAGPMEVPYLGIQKSDPAKRKFVYCISHSRWNDGFSAKYQFTNTKRSVIEQDVHWVQIRDQNGLLSFGRYGRPSTSEEFSPYFWMRDARDNNVRWLFERMVVSTRPDPSDAGMAYFLATGDAECNPLKLERLLEEHQTHAIVASRNSVRIEAENFRHLEGCTIENRNDRMASHALNTRLTGGKTSRIRIQFYEPFTSDSTIYDVAVRYLDEQGSRCSYTLSVNGVAQGATWQSLGEGSGWTSQTIREVAIRRGDEIMVEVQGAEGETGKLDYVQLNAAARVSGLGRPN